MATRMQQRRGTAAQWISTNNGNGPVLNVGEIGFETDTNKFKIGDGTNHWVDLVYFLDAASALGAVTDLVDGAPDLLNTLNELAAAIGDDPDFLSSLTAEIDLKQNIVTGVSDSEISYLSNVTSDIQAQIDSKANSSELAENVVDAVANALSAGDGLDKSYDDNAGTLTLNIDSTVATKTYADDAVSTHSNDTTSIHGIDDTAELATKTFAANLLVNATKTNIQITGDKDGITIVAENGVADSTTDNLAEGATNQYYTDARVETKLSTSVRDGIEWDNVTNELYVDETTVQFRVADVSDTEIGYLNGVTSAIQTQIDAKAPSANPEFSISSVIGLALTGGFDSTTQFTSLTDDGTSSGATHLRVTGTLFDGDYAISGISEGVVTLVTPGVDAGLVSAYPFPSMFMNGEISYIGPKTISATELSHLDGVTSGIQAQIDAKAPLADPTFTGTATTDALVVNGDFTVNGTNFSASATSITIEDNMVQLAHTNAANTVDLGLVVAYNDGAAKHAGIVRDVSEAKWKLFKGVSTEPSTVVAFGEGSLDDLAINDLEAVDATFTGTVTGVTASMVGLGDVDNTADADKPVSTATQTALDAKLDSVTTINAQTANYTLVLSDKDKMVEMNVGSANTLTVPANSSVAYPIGTKINIVQTGSGQTTLTAGGGVTINGTPGLKTRAQWSAVTLVKRATDTWVAFGDLTA